MIEMTSSQRKMLAQIQKSKKKGIRWDKLYQKYGDVASYQELKALTQQGLLKIVNANGTEMDVPGRIPNPPEASELYAVCTWTARDTIERDEQVVRKDWLSRIISVIGVVMGLISLLVSLGVFSPPNSQQNTPQPILACHCPNNCANSEQKTPCGEP